MAKTGALRHGRTPTGVRVANMRIPFGMSVRTGAHWQLLNARVVTGQMRHDMHSSCRIVSQGLALEPLANG
jgi:hypothetical protein